MQIWLQWISAGFSRRHVKMRWLRMLEWYVCWCLGSCNRQVANATQHTFREHLMKAASKLKNSGNTLHESLWLFLRPWRQDPEVICFWRKAVITTRDNWPLHSGVRSLQRLTLCVVVLYCVRVCEHILHCSGLLGLDFRFNMFVFACFISSPWSISLSVSFLSVGSYIELSVPLRR